jgi:hypothetical protein
VAYRKSGLCSKKHIKTWGPGNLIFLIEFHISNFYELVGLETDLKVFGILRRYKICPVSSSDAKVMTVLRKLLESGFQWTQVAN